MKEFIIITAVFVGMAIAVEFAYLRCIAIVNRMQFRVPRRRRMNRRSSNRQFIGRPELDFDLHVRKVDKIRFGDEV